MAIKNNQSFGNFIVSFSNQQSILISGIWRHLVILVVFWFDRYTLTKLDNLLQIMLLNI